MTEGSSKILLWQVVLAAVAGLVWFLLWEVSTGTDTGFFFDLPWGLLIGFLLGLAVILGVAIIAGAIWALVSKLQSSGGSFGDAMGANLDQAGASSAVVGLNRTLGTWDTSAVAWGIGWVVGVALLWGLAGGIVWRFELGFAVTVVVALVLAAVGALVITGLVHVTDDLAVAIGEGYSWLERPLSSMRITPGLGGAIAWGVVGLLAAGGLGAGLTQDLVLAAVTFIAALVAGIIGVQLRASMDAK